MFPFARFRRPPHSEDEDDDDFDFDSILYGSSTPSTSALRGGGSRSSTTGGPRNSTISSSKNHYRSSKREAQSPNDEDDLELEDEDAGRGRVLLDDDVEKEEEDQIRTSTRGSKLNLKHDVETETELSPRTRYNRTGEAEIISEASSSSSTAGGEKIPSDKLDPKLRRVSRVSLDRIVDVFRSQQLGGLRQSQTFIGLSNQRSRGLGGRISFAGASTRKSSVLVGMNSTRTVNRGSILLGNGAASSTPLGSPGIAPSSRRVGNRGQKRLVQRALRLLSGVQNGHLYIRVDEHVCDTEVFL